MDVALNAIPAVINFALIGYGTQKPAFLPLVASLYGAAFVGFGANIIVNPVSGLLSFFEVAAPVTAEGKHLLAVFSIIYGPRDIFMGAAIFATALFGSFAALGWITFAAGIVAAIDGVACKVVVGAGEWNHWGYAPFVVLLGAVILWKAGEVDKPKAIAGKKKA